MWAVIHLQIVKMSYYQRLATLIEEYAVFSTHAVNSGELVILDKRAKAAKRNHTYSCPLSFLFAALDIYIPFFAVFPPNLTSPDR